MRKTLAFLVSAAVLSGCGSPVSSSKETAPAVAPASAVASEGPRARLDTTQEEETRWAHVYWQCMKDHGARVDDSEKAKAIGFVDPSQATPEIFAACAAKKPNFVPREMDPSLNPDYEQQWHEDVKCMQRKGMAIVEVEGGWNWKSDAVIPANQDEIERECQIEAFGGK